MSIVIIILIIIAVAVLFTFFRIRASVASTSNYKSMFINGWRSNFGSTPPESVTTAFQNAAMVILSNVPPQTSSSAIPSKNLAKYLDELGDLLGTTSDKYEMTVGCLLALCVDRSGQPLPGSSWATNILTMRYMWR